MSETDGFKQRFEIYGGDYDAATEHFLGDEAFFRNVLEMLADDTCVARIGEALKKGDLRAAFEAAHELKGVSANLCLAPLYDAVCSLVEPLRAGDARDYGPLFCEVEKRFAEALKLLK